MRVLEQFSTDAYPVRGYVRVPASTVRRPS
jgi:hypothetical protein